MKIPSDENVVLIFNEHRSRKSYIISSKSGNFNFNFNMRTRASSANIAYCNSTCSAIYNNQQPTTTRTTQNNTEHTSHINWKGITINEFDECAIECLAVSGGLAAWHPACWKYLHIQPPIPFPSFFPPPFPFPLAIPCAFLFPNWVPSIWLQMPHISGYQVGVTEYLSPTSTPPYRVCLCVFVCVCGMVGLMLCASPCQIEFLAF